MLVEMAVVPGVAMSVVEVVNMIVVHDGLVSTVLAVLVFVIWVGHVRQSVLVVVVLVCAVRMTVMDVVGMPIVIDGGVPARRAVIVWVFIVNVVLSRGHDPSLL